MSKVLHNNDTIIIQKYTEENKSLKKISSEINRSKYYVWSRLRFNKINLRPKGRSKRIKEIMFKTGKKEVYLEILNMLTPKGVAWWYCDDGNIYINKKRYLNYLTLATNGFNKKSIDLIIKMFLVNQKITQ